jgi:hypothetical protein
MATSAERAAWRPWQTINDEASDQEQKTDLQTRDSDTNMCCLNHTDIVRTIADGEKERFLVLFNKLNNQRLLKR